MTRYPFSKSFQVTKMETFKRLEEGIKRMKPIEINSKDVISQMRKRVRKREGRLLKLI